jgi:uncharacterized membrane protein
MKSNQEFKNLALADLEGNWAKFAIATLLLFFISGGVGAAFDIFFFRGTSNLWSLLCLPLTWGYDVLFLRLIRKEHSNVERMFDGYKDFVRVFLLVLLKSIAVLIGFCLFIVPGIILALGFAMSDYILADDKEISSYDALKESWSLMKSHKTQLFWLSLSFIGWIILSFLTLGIGFLFLCPYMETTLAHFYEELKTDSII